MEVMKFESSKIDSKGCVCNCGCPCWCFPSSSTATSGYSASYSNRDPTYTEDYQRYN